MCGRYSFATSKEKVEKQLGIPAPSPFRTSYNIAPTQSAYVITDDQPDRLQAFRWGLIPYWSKDAKTTNHLFNARSEGIASKPSFRMPIRKHRCLIVADSFYEWQKTGKGMASNPFRITLHDGALLVFAGIWDTWDNPEGEALNSFSIITTRPNAEMSQLHSRMPVILPNKDLQNRWLQEKDLLEALAILQPIEDGMLKYYPISPAINKADTDYPELHKEIQLPPTLF